MYRTERMGSVQTEQVHYGFVLDTFAHLLDERPPKVSNELPLNEAGKIALMNNF